MKQIELTQGYSTIVDDEDYEMLSQYKWYYNNGYAVTTINLKKIYMHRLIMSTPDNMFTDHINGNELDNQKSNLRICSRQENGANRKKSSNTSSIYKGVHYHKQRKYFASAIEVDGKKIHLGEFSLEIDAAKAYDKAAIKHFGQYAKLNFSENL